MPFGQLWERIGPAVPNPELLARGALTAPLARLKAGHVPSISTGWANGSISVIGRPKAIFGYAFANVSIITCKRLGVSGALHSHSSDGPTSDGDSIVCDRMP